MNVLVRVPVSVPRGASVRVVDNEDPALGRCPLVIEASAVDFPIIVRKFWDYRIWYKLADTTSRPDVMPADGRGRIDVAIRDLCCFNQNDSAFLGGVDSVTVFYPRIIGDSVVKQLADFPPRLPLLKTDSVGYAAKSIHVDCGELTKSLAVVEQCLDVDVPDPGVFLCLNNPRDPAWATYIPEEGPMPLMAQGPVFNRKQYSETTAWDLVARFLGEQGVSASGTPYPNGENEYPDYDGCWDGEHFDVEMTSVPNLGKWIISAGNRDLEKTIATVARQPNESLEEVIAEFSRVLGEEATPRYARKSQIRGLGEALCSGPFELVLARFVRRGDLGC